MGPGVIWSRRTAEFCTYHFASGRRCSLLSYVALQHPKMLLAGTALPFRLLPYLHCSPDNSICKAISSFGPTVSCLAKLFPALPSFDRLAKQCSVILDCLVCVFLLNGTLFAFSLIHKPIVFCFNILRACTSAASCTYLASPCGKGTRTTIARHESSTSLHHRAHTRR